ncbi:MFS transporter [Peribacillus sp. SCS-37]|uniref:MFS transporter n=1 Tax=Paraperibacillus esterisolvens TaxID=3115296 RepID=UPI0039061ECA
MTQPDTAQHSKLWTRQYTLIILITFIFFLSLQALMGGFPAFVTGITEVPSKGGLMTTSFMLAAILTRPFIGILMHKIQVKMTLILSMFFVLATIIASFGKETFAVLIVLRILQGICFGIITTLLATLATSMIPDGRLGEGIGFFGMATSLGTSFGPMAALTIVHSSSFNNLLLFTLILIILSLAASLLIQSKKNEPSIKPVRNSNLLAYAFDKRALLPGILVSLFYVTFSGIVNYIDGLGAANGFGGRVSLFFLIIAGMMILTRPATGKIYDRFGHRFLVYTASICGITGLVLLTMTHSFPMLCAAAIFYGVAYSVMQPTFQAWAVSRVSPDKKGTANAMTLNFMDFGMALGAAVMGNVAVHTSYNAAFGFSSFLIVILLAIYIGVRAAGRRALNTAA